LVLVLVLVLVPCVLVLVLVLRPGVLETSLPIGSYFFQKPRFFRVKGIYFVARICDKWGRSW